MLKRIEYVDVHGAGSTPVVPVRIVDCGELVDGKCLGSITVENGNACSFGIKFSIFKYT